MSGFQGVRLKGIKECGIGATIHYLHAIRSGLRPKIPDSPVEGHQEWGDAVI
jgi:hypothetical protein